MARFAEGGVGGLTVALLAAGVFPVGVLACDHAIIAEPPEIAAKPVEAVAVALIAGHGPFRATVVAGHPVAVDLPCHVRDGGKALLQHGADRRLAVKSEAFRRRAA